MATTFEETIALIWQNVDQIKKTTTVLKEHFGINGYGFFQIDYDNKFFQITDVPEVLDYLLERKVHLRSPYLRHPDSFQAGFKFNDVLPPEEQKDVVQIGHTMFSFQNVLSFIEKTQNGVEFSFFWGKKDTKQLEDLALNQQPLLKKYIEHFKKQHTPLLKKLKDQALDLSKALKDNYYNFEKPKSFLSHIAIFELLKELDMIELWERSRLLSNKERQCLHFVLFGKSAKETAHLLHLSPRTVEAYLGIARNKLGCKNKSELFSYAQNLAKFNLL